MPRSRIGKLARSLAALTIAGLTVTACSVGSVGGNSGGGGASGGTTEISFLTSSDTNTAALGDALIKGFEAENPNIKIDHETQPSGTEGDNLTKTKLSTGEMSDVFYYNSGSLFQALNPATNLTPLTDQPWVSELTPGFKDVVTAGSDVYGAPVGTTQAGAVMYNKKVYDSLGLKVPTTWDEFIANSQKIKAAGKVTPIEQTYGDTWTSQLFVLGDFANVAAQDPNWAADYTAGKAKYANQPALQSFLNQQQVHDLGLENKDFASAKLDDGVKALAQGQAAQYPILTGVLATVKQNYPDNVNDIGVFPLPAQKAADTRLTIWQPNAVYIPKTTTGDKLEAAKKFITWINSSAGCQVQNQASSTSGPYSIKACTLPSDVPAAVKDMAPYIDGGKSGPALEFVSPIKGPNLENITVEVGSGIKSGADGAKSYDEDVKKQAQQLGLPGW